MLLPKSPDASSLCFIPRRFFLFFGLYHSAAVLIRSGAAFFQPNLFSPPLPASALSFWGFLPL